MCLLTHRAAIGSSAAPKSLLVNAVWLIRKGKGGEGAVTRAPRLVDLWNFKGNLDSVSCTHCLTVSAGTKPPQVGERAVVPSRDPKTIWNRLIHHLRFLGRLKAVGDSEGRSIVCAVWARSLRRCE